VIAPALSGRRVLVTRASEDAAAWAERLASLGAEPVILPCIRSELLDDARTRAILAAALHETDWLCLTSPRGVEAVATLAGPPAPAVRLAAVGDATAAAIRAAFGRTPFVAAGGTSRALGDELAAALRATVPTPVRAARVLMAVAEGGRTDAEDVLDRAGARVTRVNVYRTVPAAPAEHPVDLGAERIFDVLFASPSAVYGLLNQALLPADARIFTIGPTTSAAVAAAGLTVSGEALRPDLESLLEAMQ
jgi:uroporphyrinogen-III synthase